MNKDGSIGGVEPEPTIIHGLTGWEQHLKSRQHRKLKTSKAEMERDGPSWWFWKAQEYKKRKRDGTLNSENAVVGKEEHSTLTTNVAETASSTYTAEECGEKQDGGDDAAGSAKVRRTGSSSSSPDVTEKVE